METATDISINLAVIGFKPGETIEIVMNDGLIYSLTRTDHWSTRSGIIKGVSIMATRTSARVPVTTPDKVVVSATIVEGKPFKMGHWDSDGDVSEVYLMKNGRRHKQLI